LIVLRPVIYRTIVRRLINRIDRPATGTEIQRSVRPGIEAVRPGTEAVLPETEAVRPGTADQRNIESKT